MIGVGGTASTDGGAGLRDASAPCPSDVELVAALDVQNPLLGPDGAAAAFGPQKGASPAQVAELEERLRRLASADRRAARGRRGRRDRRACSWHSAREAVPGAALVAAEAGLADALHGAELCITAEGRIDRQTLSGKVVAEVADICGRAGVQCIAVGGIVEPVAAEELRRRGCETHEQGDLERAGRELASRCSSPSG